MTLRNLKTQFNKPLQCLDYMWGLSCLMSVPLLVLAATLVLVVAPRFQHQPTNFNILAPSFVQQPVAYTTAMTLTFINEATRQEYRYDSNTMSFHPALPKGAYKIRGNVTYYINGTSYVTNINRKYEVK